MRTDGSGKVIKIPNSEQQENVKNTRKTLKVLQQTATDKENLVGRLQRSGKDILTNKLSHSESHSSEPKSRVKLTNRSTQTGSGSKIDIKDLTSEAGPSEHYWELLAEKRRQALDESLDENRRLIEENSSLREENRVCKEMLDESKSLVEVLTEMLAENENETNETVAETTEDQ